MTSLSFIARVRKGQSSYLAVTLTVTVGNKFNLILWITVHKFQARNRLENVMKENHSVSLFMQVNGLCLT